MISVEEVVVDPDMIAPQPYVILRSTGMFVSGGFQSVTTPISVFGPVQQASNKEIQMIPEADRVGAVRSFWATQPFFLTRGAAPVPSVHGEVPTGSGTVYALSSAPPDGAANVYVGGLRLRPDADYAIDGAALTFVAAPGSAAVYVTWQVTAMVGQAASDIIQWDSQQYRILSTYRDPGGGYWKALGTRMAAA